MTPENETLALVVVELNCSKGSSSSDEMNVMKIVSSWDSLHSM